MSRTQMEKSMEEIVNVFHQYSVRTGDFETLSKKELRQLIEQQIPSWLKEHLQCFQELFEKLDENKDQQISFGEFMAFVTKMLIAVHEHIHDGHDHGPGHGPGSGHGPGHGHGHSHGPGH